MTLSAGRRRVDDQDVAPPSAVGGDRDKLPVGKRGADWGDGRCRRRSARVRSIRIIVAVRCKLGDDAAKPWLIETVYGLGYRLAQAGPAAGR